MKIKNKWANCFFNRFDAPIRFLYTRTGVLSRLINRTLFWRFYHCDYRGVDAKFHRAQAFVGREVMNFEGKAVLELGPGNSYVDAYHFLLNGASKVVMLDKYPRLSESSRQSDLEKAEAEYVLAQYPGAESNRFCGTDGLDKRRIEFVAGDLVDLAGSGTFDFIYSTSVLEHVRGLDVSLVAMARLIKPGGYMYHFIDLRDHYNFNVPFLFYKYSDEAWERYLTKEGISYTNRIRYDDYRRMFQSCGFEVVKERTERFPSGGNSSVNARFSGRGDLDVGILEVLMRKAKN